MIGINLTGNIFVTAFQKVRSPCLSTTSHMYIQSKCDTWFIMIRDRLLNFPSNPNVRILTPYIFSAYNHGIGQNMTLTDLT